MQDFKGKPVTDEYKSFTLAPWHEVNKPDFIQSYFFKLFLAIFGGALGWLGSSKVPINWNVVIEIINAIFFFFFLFLVKYSAFKL